MFDLIEGLYYFLQAVGLWEKLLNVHEAKVKAQQVADSPVTKDELLQTLEDGKL